MSAAPPPPAPPFVDDAECLEALLGWLDLVLTDRVARTRAELKGNPWLRGVRIDDAEVDALLRRGPMTPPWACQPADPALTRRIERTGRLTRARLAAGADALRWARLGPLFGLDDLDGHILLLALAVEFDPRYGRLVGWLHDDIARRRPSVGLALELFVGPLASRLLARERLGAGAPLIRAGLLRLAEGPIFAERDLVPAPGLVRWLAGGAPVDPTEARAPRRWTPSDMSPDVIADVSDDSTGGIIDEIAAAVRRGTTRLVAVSGSAGSGRQRCAQRLAERLDRPLYVLDVEPIQEALTERVTAAALAARLEDGVLCLRHADALDRVQGVALRRTLGRGMPRLVVVTRSSPWHPPATPGLPPVVPIVLPALPSAARAALWRRALSARAADEMAGRDSVDVSDVVGGLSDTIAGVADAFRFGPGPIEDAASTAWGYAIAAGRPMPSTDDLFRAARAHATPELGTLAQRVSTPHAWGDLIVDPTRRAQLEGLVARMRHRTRIDERWGFGGRITGGRGVTALFVGPPGTGKTMAAGLVAAAARRDLYRIDLSQIVSKYIGETEKQLERVFTEAESTDAALFFDEADALFGKRGEVKDAHDRHANIEVAYLLQRLERFSGLVVLATNLRKNIDEAFMRRMDVVIDFPLPDVEARTRLWARIWPAAAPVSADLDPADLARRFDLAGGHIRNIALGAAFAAAGDDGPIELSHVLAAAYDEYRKLGRLVDARRFARAGV